MTGPPPDPATRVDATENPLDDRAEEQKRRPVLWLMVLIPALVVLIGVLGTRLLDAAIDRKAEPTPTATTIDSDDSITPSTVQE